MEDKTMVRRSMLVAAVFGALVLTFASAAMAQEEGRHELSGQGTGFFTKDSNGRGIFQHSTDTGGVLGSYRFHFNSWLAAEGAYGYARTTQQNFTPVGTFGVQSNVHQITGAGVVKLPWSLAHLKPYVLAGAGALVFDPRANAGGFVPGAARQTKAAFVYGGGADYNFYNHFSLRVQYRGLVYKRPDFGLASLDSDVIAHTAQPSAGIVFRF